MAKSLAGRIYREQQNLVVNGPLLNAFSSVWPLRMTLLRHTVKILKLQEVRQIRTLTAPAEAEPCHLFRDPALLP
jgi:hypothetical protein